MPTHNPGHAELQSKHQVELLALEPADCIGVLGHGQGLTPNPAKANTALQKGLARAEFQRNLPVHRGLVHICVHRATESKMEVQ